MKRILVLVSLAAASVLAFAAKKDVTYFKCPVVEEDGKTVNVYFAIKGFDAYDRKGELIQYPGSNQQFGLIHVDPGPTDDYIPMMSNLNGQGGDLRITEEGYIYLFGDGDGYQFTDLVLWDDGNEQQSYTTGYVRDYGSARGDGPDFKQFITCERSNSKL